MPGRRWGSQFEWANLFHISGLVDAGAPATRPGIAFVVRR